MRIFNPRESDIDHRLAVGRARRGIPGRVRREDDRDDECARRPWFRARAGAHLAPAILTPFEPVAGQLVMPFLALVEARFVARFRKHGLSLQTIRKVAQKLRDKHRLEHPFATSDASALTASESCSKKRRTMASAVCSIS
jgi:hypothetical protein